MTDPEHKQARPAEFLTDDELNDELIARHEHIVLCYVKPARENDGSSIISLVTGNDRSESIALAEYAKLRVMAHYYTSTEDAEDE